MITSLVLRPYQQTLVNNVIDVIERGDKNTLVISPTGSGKTCSFIELAKLLIERMNDDEVIMVISHLSLLTQQTVKKFEKFSNLPTGILQAQKQPSNDDRVIVTTVQSAKIFDKILTYYQNSGKKVKYIIVDECHRSHNSSYDLMFDSFKDATVINFTASPFKGKRLATHHYDSIAFQISLQEMINQSYLVRPILMQITFDQVETSARCAIMLKTYCEYEKGKKAIVFMRSKEECQILVDAMTGEGITAVVVTDDTATTKRDKVFADYDTDKLDVLVSVSVLEAGFDSLLCESVFMFGTQSPAVYMQRIGRALRPMDGDSVKPHHSKQTARCYVLGDLPTIESGVYEKHHNSAIKPKQYSECTSIDERIDWLENAEMTDTDEYRHNTAGLKVQRLANKINMEVLKRLITEQSVPAQFLLKLAKGADTFKPIQKGDVPASTQQITELRKLGIKPDPNLTSNEARFIAHSLGGAEKHHVSSDRFILKDGKFAGSHVKDLSWSYKSVVLKRMPNSNVAKLIREYHNKK